MQELDGKVAVVTGAASGIGRAMIERFAAQGMKVVLADVEEEALAKADAEVAATGAETLAKVTDVSSRASVDELAAAVTERFGGANVLCNNAGVSGGAGSLWDTTEKDWSWVLGVNLMGVVHGMQAFVPAMVASGEPGHVVNTSSVLGLATGGGSIYGVTKHAVTRLSEGLWYDLRAANASVGVSVLCPGMIATNIIGSGRNRPSDLQNETQPPTPEMRQRMDAMQQLFSRGHAAGRSGRHGPRRHRVGSVLRVDPSRGDSRGGPVTLRRHPRRRRAAAAPGRRRLHVDGAPQALTAAPIEPADHPSS